MCIDIRIFKFSFNINSINTYKKGYLYFGIRNILYSMFFFIFCVCLVYFLFKQPLRM